MSEHQSLADQAVETLAAVKEMASGLELEHPERHVVREMKALAERLIVQALELAAQLVENAKEIRKLQRAAEAERG